MGNRMLRDTKNPSCASFVNSVHKILQDTIFLPTVTQSLCICCEMSQSNGCVNCSKTLYLACNKSHLYSLVHLVCGHRFFIVLYLLQ